MKLRNHFKTLYGFIVGLLVIILLLGIVLKGESKQKNNVEDMPLVRTQIINPSGAEQSYTYSGIVRGRYESQLAFQVSGKIVSRNINLGSVVRPGDVLMRIDPVDIERGAESADAQVSAAQSQYQLAKDNFERYGRLYQKGLVSQVDYDRMKTAYDGAAAMLRQAKAQNANSKSMLNYCNLYADSTGVITNVMAEVGQVVGAGQPVVTLVRDNEKEVEINVPENRLEEMRNARQLNVKFWALPNLIVIGKVREVAPMADLISRTYIMRISLLNPPQDLKLGMTAEVMVADSATASVIYIPLSAIYQTGNTPAVWAVKDGVVNLRPVKIGGFGDDQVQVLEGLQAGDTVVTAGVHKLRGGQKVRVEGEVQ
jgi:membrane fusion protein, multidrug efflux system